MAATRTYTHTVALPRLSLIKIQVGAALRRGTGINDRQLETIKRALTNRWITAVMMHGFEGSGRCRAEIMLSIDWTSHEISISTGHDMVSIGESWTDSVAPEISEVVSEFVTFCQERQLRREWRVIYSTDFDAAFLDRELGFRRAARVEWAETPVDLPLKIRELSELSLVIRLVG
jgi:hypothetical protein